MKILKSSLLGMLGLLAASVAQAATCGGNLATYVSYGDSESCSSGVLNYTSFFFRELTSTGNITASMINVNALEGGGVGFSDANPASTLMASIFNRNITVPERYYISYLVDPPPVVAGDELFLDPPMGPITVSKWTCPDDVFKAGSVSSALSGLGPSSYSAAFTCLNQGTGSNPYFLQVDGDPSGLNLFDSVAYPQLASFVSVRLVIDLGVGQIQGLGAIESRTVVPEPAAFVPLAAAVLGLGALVRRRRANKA